MAAGMTSSHRGIIGSHILCFLCAVGNKHGIQQTQTPQVLGGWGYRDEMMFTDPFSALHIMAKEGQSSLSVQ